VIEWVTPRLDQALSLRNVTKLVGLSPSRTRHLFVEQTGLSFRTYLLWLRLERAVQLFARGASLTEAAHGAGFADSAHLSRTFRRMFGIPAASLRLA
jgi:AraC-like DNA-binding protein